MIFYKEELVQIILKFIVAVRKLMTEWIGVRQDGDKRMPTKEEQKQLYLDVLGVPASSIRRSTGRGIYWRVRFSIL